MADDSGPPPCMQKVRAACKRRGAAGAKGFSRLVIMASFILMSLALLGGTPKKNLVGCAARFPKPLAYL